MRTIDAALQNGRERPAYAYIAPQLKQSKAIAWEYLKSYTRPLPGLAINESELYVQLPTGARIRIFGADNPDSLRGLYFDGVVLDEVSDMRPEVWDSIILPALLDRDGWADFIGTPRGINLFSEMYYKALENPDWYAALHTVYDTGALTEEQIELARTTMPEAQFRQEFMCDFNAGNSNSLMSVDIVNAASGRSIAESTYSFAPKILGVDVARQGDDSSVIFRRQGLASWNPRVLHGADSTSVAAAVMAEMSEFQPDAVFIDGSGGYGAGVVDRLRLLGHTPIEVQFGGSATNPRYANKRMEMYWELSEWLKSGGCIPSCPALKVELCTPTYTHENARGVMKLESKDDIKKRMGKSPDRADALALTFAHPVAPRRSPVELAQAFAARALTNDYDPFSR